MTPPQRKKSFTIPLTFPLAASALALSLLSLPAQATLSNPPARASLEGLRLVGEATVPTLRDMVVRAGMEAIGTPYSWGGDDPEDGFDCSGLVLFVYREIAGVNLPRTARAQRKTGKAVTRTQLQPGDLVFFTTRGRRGGISHVGMYIGRGEFVHAPSRGDSVRVDRLDNTYWHRNYAGARRYLKGGETRVASAGQP
ncbi:lipoprotein [Bordetella ansorpii]|uniref:Lipoprotein n=1 Tax=Bordetella ansorpii TaxID=288768 RepID=A0A157R7Q2_9BORD|nr:C40 family peptidase [Bordetella ansorpii]SAI54125.1 lipoprotein [Bordetella ansorpii]